MENMAGKFIHKFSKTEIIYIFFNLRLLPKNWL